MYRPEDVIPNLGVPPGDLDEFNEWLEQSDIINFLAENAHSQDILLYASLNHTFVHAVFVPKSEVEPPDIDYLMSWDGNPSSGRRVNGDEKLSSKKMQSGKWTVDDLSDVHQIIFRRCFSGVPEREDYFDLRQEFVHENGIHFLRERSAWCRLDARGRIEEVARLVDVPKTETKYGGKLVLCSRDLLENYASLTDTAILRMFDIARFRERQFSGWGGASKRDRRNKGDHIHYDIYIDKGHASLIRGIQIISPVQARTPAPIDHHLATSSPKFEEFLALDWKNYRVASCSCDPSKLSSYFESGSRLPFETTVAFFDPEVLARYKADREVYELTEYTISCRGAWSLERYHVNDSGQVFTYLIYLSRLPSVEQKYWQLFNRAPKPGIVPDGSIMRDRHDTLRRRQEAILKVNISERAFATDFQGDFLAAVDPLRCLKNFLNELDRAWWRPRDTKVIENVQYPNVGSNDDWRREILNLDHLIVESFDVKWLARIARSLGQEVKTNSVNESLKKCLIGVGYDPDRAEEVVSPFVEIRQHRNALVGHPDQQKATIFKEKAFEEHGGYRDSFLTLAGRCKDSMIEVSRAFARFVDDC